MIGFQPDDKWPRLKCHVKDCPNCVWDKGGLKNIAASYSDVPMWCCPDHIPVTQHLSRDVMGEQGETSDNRVRGK